MNNKKLHSIKEFLLFMLLNIIFVDSFSVLILIGLFLWLMIYAVEQNVISEITCFFIISLALMLFLILKCIVMILYYKIFYNKISNSIIIKFFSYLQKNSKHQNIFKFIIFLPYIAGIILSCLFDIKTVRIQHFFQNSCLSVLSSGLISYSMLFIYWDYEQNLKNHKQAKAILLAIKQHILSIFVILILVILMFVISD